MHNSVGSPEPKAATRIHNQDDRDKNNNLSAKKTYKEVRLEAGQQVTFNRIGMSKATRANLEQATSWQTGRLIFEDHTLEDVLKDLNRYSKNQILIGDDSLAGIRITGVFKTGDNRKIVQTLKAYFAVRVSSDRYGNLILDPAASKPAS